MNHSTHARNAPLARWLAAALLGLLLLSRAAGAAAQDAGTDAAAEAPDAADAPDADGAAPDAPPRDDTFIGPPNPTQLPEPWRAQRDALLSDDPSVVASALDLPEDTYATPTDLDTRRDLVRALQAEAQDERAALVEQLQQLDALIGDLTPDPADSHALAMLSGLRRSAVQRLRAQDAQRRADLDAQLQVHDAELAFLDRRHLALQQNSAELAEEVDRGRRNREAAEREKVEAAESREATERRLAQAEAEQRAAAQFEEAYQQLAQQEPRILEEKLYIEARRQYELSAELEQQGKDLSAFNTWRDTTLQTSRTLHDRLDRREKTEEAQAEALTLYNKLTLERQRAREAVADLELPLRLTRKSLDGVDTDVTQARQRVFELSALSQDDPNPLNRKRLSVAQAESERQIAYQQLLELKLQILNENQDLAFERLLFARNAQEDLLDALPESARDDLYTPNAFNFARVPGELSDFTTSTRHYLKQRALQLDALGAAATSLSGVFWILKLLAVCGLLVFSISFIRSHRDGWLKNLSEAALKQRLLRKRRPFLLKLLEILNAVLLPLASLLFVQLLLGLFPQDAPLVVIATVLINSSLIYAIVINIIKTMVLPRWYREAEAEADASTNPTDTAADHLPQGADLLDLNVQVALFAVSTLRWMLLYTIACQYTLYLVRSALGDFFIAHWVAVFGYLGYLVVIYTLLSRWREPIAARFASLLEHRSPQAVAFVLNRKNAFYGVGVIGGALVYVLAREGYQRLRRWMTHLEVTQQVQNFLFRKRLEMGKSRSSREELRDLERDLPDTFRDRFAPTPLRSAEGFVPRPVATQALHAARDAWRDGGCGSIALIGEQGMGKTTLLLQLRDTWQAQGQTVTWVSLPPRITAPDDVHRLLALLFGLPDDLHTDALLQHILQAEPRTVIIDDAHHCFLKRIGGFAALDALRELVRLTDHRHCWILTFNLHAWRYIERVSDRAKLLGQTVTLPPLDDDALQLLVESRTQQSDLSLDYSRLLIDDLPEDELWDAAHRSARGYFRLLAEASRGNPTIAMHLWLRSLTPQDAQVLQVGLFTTRPIREVAGLPDDLKFTLAAIIQHDSLNVAELTDLTLRSPADLTITLNFLEDRSVIRRDPRTGRARVTTAFYRQILSHLGDNNILQQ